jgi:hypothetical protein
MTCWSLACISCATGFGARTATPREAAFPAALAQPVVLRRRCCAAFGARRPAPGVLCMPGAGRRAGVDFDLDLDLDFDFLLLDFDFYFDFGWWSAVEVFLTSLSCLFEGVRSGTTERSGATRPALVSAGFQARQGGAAPARACTWVFCRCPAGVRPGCGRGAGAGAEPGLPRGPGGVHVLRACRQAPALGGRGRSSGPQGVLVSSRIPGVVPVPFIFSVRGASGGCAGASTGSGRPAPGCPRRRRRRR